MRCADPAHGAITAELADPSSLVSIRPSPACQRSGLAEPYLRRLAEHGWSGGEPQQESLRQVVADVAAELYRDQAAPPVERLPQSTLRNSRDRNYWRPGVSWPGRFRKKHAMSHAQGGREEDQLLPAGTTSEPAAVPAGRDIQSYLAANPGLFCFVRLAYPHQTSTDVPAEVEYGVMAEGGGRLFSRFCGR